MPNGSWGGCARSRLRPRTSETLCAGRFTAADIVIGYALRLASSIGLAKDFGPNVTAYWDRLRQRQAYQRALAAETAGRGRAEYRAASACLTKLCHSGVASCARYPK